jgi:arginyl-tRNA synthetase
MSALIQALKTAGAAAVTALFNTEWKSEDILINQTKPEFEGDYTLVTFAIIKVARLKPEEAGQKLGEYLVAHHSDLVTGFNVIKGFLNLHINETWWNHFIQANYNNSTYGIKAPNHTKVMIEYSSPNTNKPLHFGHMRNIYLGYAVAEILKANGYDVVKANLVNDRGIHICKSMIAWQLYANGATPASSGIKGDHLVGDYYVKFNDVYKQEVADLMNGGLSKEEAEKEAPIMKAAQEMLRQWEAGDPAVRELWAEMNSWVYEGFFKTYARLGVDFDKMYYESNTYLLGKTLVEEGLRKGVLFQKEDGSVWVDLTGDGLDEKLLLRGDGTSVYITQDLGTAVLKYNDFKLDQSVYVIGDEQNYHMKVLKLILQKLGEPCADGIYHLSYGMVELPTGRMKSREGTVVDADDMLDEMVALAKEESEKAGKANSFEEVEQNALFNTIGMGALKFYLLRVDPKKKMIFNPEESIDLHGFTATSVQYTHSRTRSVYNKLKEQNYQFNIDGVTLGMPLEKLEKELLLHLEQYPMILESAAAEFSPAHLCNYAYDLAKLFNTFYGAHSIAKAENEEKKNLRFMLSEMTGMLLKNSMQLLGIAVPERM